MKRNIETTVVVSLIICLLSTTVSLISLSPSNTRRENSVDQSRKNIEISPELAAAKALVFLPERVSPGFTLYPQSGNGQVQLLNTGGEVIHQWKVDATRARLLPNCNLLVVHGTKWGQSQSPWSSLTSVIREYSWDGEVDWEYRDSGRVHHDVHKLPSGNYLFLRKVFLGDDEKRALIVDQRKQKAIFRSDAVVEISPAGVVQWKWLAHRHLDPNSCGRFPCLLQQKVLNRGSEFDWSHMNAANPLPENSWYDAGDKRFRPGNLLVMPRNLSTVYLVDRETKKVVWEYTGEFRGGLQGGHEPHMIRKGLPGAGNILIFDNGRRRGYSIILEVEPPSGRLVWYYEAGSRFFSGAAGSVQRLPNGNTLIAEDKSGRVFEVTEGKRKVWEYLGSRMRTARPRRYALNYCSEFEMLPSPTMQEVEQEARISESNTPEAISTSRT